MANNSTKRGPNTLSEGTSRPTSLPKGMMDPFTMEYPISCSLPSPRTPRMNVDNHSGQSCLPGSRPSRSWSGSVPVLLTPPPTGEFSGSTSRAQWNIPRGKDYPTPSGQNRSTPLEFEANVMPRTPQYWGPGTNKAFKFPTLEDPFIGRGDSSGTVRRRKRIPRDALRDSDTPCPLNSKATYSHLMDQQVERPFNWAVNSKEILPARQDNQPYSQSTDDNTDWLGVPTNNNDWRPANSAQAVWGTPIDHPETVTAVEEPSNIHDSYINQPVAMETGPVYSHDQGRKILHTEEDMMKTPPVSYQDDKEMEQPESHIEEMKRSQHTLRALETKIRKDERTMTRRENRASKMKLLREHEYAAEGEDEYSTKEQAMYQDQHACIRLDRELTLQVWVLFLGALACFLLGMALASRQAGLVVVVHHQAP